MIARYSRAALAAALLGCSGQAAVVDSSTSGAAFDESASNPFLEEQGTSGKADSQYLNPDGVEVEVDIEADIEGPDYKLADGPAVLGQFAMTYLRKTSEIYLESLAEQGSSDERVEWKDGERWLSARDAEKEGIKRTHFRIRGINAVLLHSSQRVAELGTKLTAPVPVRPFSIMADAGGSCGEEGGHIGLDQSVYWYLWEPDKAGCKAQKQDMTITVSKVLPSKITYPEYDKLTADGKVTMVVLFGQIGDGVIDDSETGVRAMKQMASWLTAGKFTLVPEAPVTKGQRFTKTVGGVVIEVDLYSPWDFAGLGDFKNYSNFEKAITGHEVIAFDGHSMLGGSDFWERPNYPKDYQIFLYGGCLGYEYYLAPILKGKGGGWENLDILSSVVEVSANANEFAGPFLAKLMYALENGYKVSWKDMLIAIRSRVGDSTFGMSGVRENCFAPTGSLCGGTAPTEGKSTSYTGEGGAKIPDASAKGVTATIEVSDTATLTDVTVALTVTHSYVSDLRITLEHDGVIATVWDHEGGGGREIDQTFTLSDFVGQSSAGKWTLQLVDSEAQDVGQLDAWSLNLLSK